VGCRPRLRTRTSLLRGVPRTLLLLMASGVRADNDDDSNYQSNPLRNMHYGGLEGLEVGSCGANEAGRCYRSEILVAFSQKHNLASVLLISSENTSLPQRFRGLCPSLRDHRSGPENLAGRDVSAFIEQCVSKIRAGIFASKRPSCFSRDSSI
jgi:hypothetical protein